MKRFLILTLLIYFSLHIYSERNQFPKWSISAEYGYNYFDGDINQDLTNIFPTSFRNITFGGSVEYALSPVMGISLEGFYFPLRAKNNSPVSLLINTDLYTGSLNATVNFTRLLFPQTTSKLYVLGSLGLGLGYYNYNVTYLNGTAIPVTDTYIDVKYGNMVRPVILQKADGSKLPYGIAATVPVSLALEYSFSRPIAIGAKIQYRSYNKDNLEGTTYLNWDGVTNDFVAAGSVYLRLKFTSKKREHTRDIQWDTYKPDKAMTLAKSFDDKINKLEKRVDSIDSKVNKLIPRIEKIEQFLSNDGPDQDGDGVPDVRDKSPDTPPNTPVDFWGNPLDNSSKKIGPRRVDYAEEDVPAVYFDFDKIDLDNNALITISKIAARMKKDPTLYVEVRGYCDYMGNNPYNNLLSQRRSDRVKAELMKVWGIPFDHIISNGKGKIIEPQSKYRPNRRCDFYFGRL